MKTFYVILFLLLEAFLLSAQSERIKNLEKVWSQQSGEDYLRNALTLSEWYADEGLYEKAADRAENAFDAAKKLNLPNYMALSLNQRGKALLKSPGRRSSLLNKAYKSYEESNHYTSDPALRLDNLQQMKDLAMMLDKRKELDKILKDIAILKGENLLNETPKTEELSGNRRQLLEKAKEIQQENRQLSEALTALSREKEKLRSQQQSLEIIVSTKEAAIRDMTAEQMRQQLVLYEQDRLLDSMAFTRLLDSMQLSQKDVVVQQQQAEIDRASAEIRLRNSQRNLLLAFACFVLLLAAGLFHRYFAIRQHNAVLAEKNRIIEEERRRSDELLLNILPVTVANELKEKGAAQARRYDEATVLFADFKDFSQISKQLSPEKLVADLDFAFTNFDKIITKYGLEKIKTIGDAYMCAGGLPGRNNAHPIHVVQAALEMQEFLRWWNYEKMNQAEPLFEARMGIHTGPLVAGVVGSKKFAYDIWGDTVNVASRMESNSEAGRVNISDTTFELVKGQFNCEYRGKVPAKNVGEVDMYFVKGV